MDPGGCGSDVYGGAAGIGGSRVGSGVSVLVLVTVMIVVMMLGDVMLIMVFMVVILLLITRGVAMEAVVGTMEMVVTVLLVVVLV